jgi:hypothetical protein
MPRTSRSFLFLNGSVVHWSQDVDIAAQSPLNASNVAYALHFYAGEEQHNEPLQSKAEVALQLGVPIVATEWGVCDWSGKAEKGLGKAAAQKWLEFMAQHHISHTAWAVNNKDETCSVLTPQTTSISGWTPSMLTEAGKWYRNAFR